MEDTISKIHLDWNDIDNLIGVIVEKVYTEYPNIDSVHGIARGGLIPAVLLSHALDLPYSQTIGKDTLVIDDICDTGKTLEKAPGIYHAVLHYKKSASFTPNIYATTVGDDWIVYPWESEDSEAIQDYLKSDEFNEFAEREDNSVVSSEGDSKLHTIGGLTNDKKGSFMKFQNKLK